MNAILRSALVVAGLAIAAQAAAETVRVDNDLDRSPKTGQPDKGSTTILVEKTPAAREGYIWVHGDWENRGDRPRWIKGHWIKDDYLEQTAKYNSQPR